MTDSAHAPLSARPGRPRPPANQGWGPVLRKGGAWLCSVWLIVAAVGKMVMERQYVGGAIVVIAGVLCLPPLYGALKARLGERLPLKVYFPIVLAVMVLGTQVADREDQANRGAAQKLEQEQRMQAAAAAREAAEREFAANKAEIVANARRTLESGDAAGALASIAKFAALKDPDLARVRDAAKLEVAMTSPLTVKDFEGSEFFAKHRVGNAKNWSLKTGGSDFSYSAPDPDGPAFLSSTGIELYSDPAAVTHVSIEFHGNSINAPATFTAAKEAFVRDFVAATFPEMKADQIVQIVNEQQSIDYDSGSVMPRVPLGKGHVAAGRSGEGLYILLER